MRVLCPVTNRAWIAVPLILGIGAVITLSNASPLYERGQSLRLAGVDTSNILHINVHARSLESYAEALEDEKEKMEKKENKTHTTTQTKKSSKKTGAEQEQTKTKRPSPSPNVSPRDPQPTHNSTSITATATTTAAPNPPLTPTIVSPTTASPTTAVLNTEPSMADPTTAPEWTPTSMTASPTATEHSPVTEPFLVLEPISASPIATPVIHKELPSENDDPPKPTPSQENILKPEPSQPPAATEQPPTSSPTTVHVPSITIKPTISAAPTTVIPTTTIAITVPASTTISHSIPSTRTTTPWLPSTIVPIEPPQATPAPSPGTSLPDAVIPDLHPVIPPNSINVQLRFERVSYSQVINNGVLAAQLVSFIPAQLGHVLDVDPSLILVLIIRDGSVKTDSAPGTESKMIKKRGLVTTDNTEDAILVTATIPRHKYWALDTLVRNQGSILYFPAPTSFGQFLDSSFQLSKHPPSKSSHGNGSGTGEGGNGGSEEGDDNDSDGDDDSSADPLTSNLPGMVNHKNSTNNSNHTSIVGSVIGLATVAYVGIAILVLRRYRRKKVQEQERLDFQQSISAPIYFHGSTQGWSWQD